MPRGVIAGAEATPGRVVCVFGPPGSGVSTLIRCLVQASRSRLKLIVPEEDLQTQVQTAVNEHIAAGAGNVEAILVDGFPHAGLRDVKDGAVVPFGAQAAQYLYDRRLVYPGAGAVIKVSTDPELLVRQKRASPGGIAAFFDGLRDLEDRIHLLNLPYFTVHNEPGEDGLAHAVGELARRARISR